MLGDLSFLGPPQIGAFLVLLQRGLEEVYSRHNTRRLLAAGATETGRGYYPVMVVGNLSWLAAVFLLLPADAPLLLFPLCLYLLLQVGRYWIIATLGRYWTHGIVTLEGAELVRSGPYRYFAHPNYAVMIAEILLLPMVFGSWALGVVAAALYAPSLLYKIALEDRALARNRYLERHRAARRATALRSPASQVAEKAPADTATTGAGTVRQMSQAITQPIRQRPLLYIVETPASPKAANDNLSPGGLSAVGEPIHVRPFTRV
jgi:methyltransferase